MALNSSSSDFNAQLAQQVPLLLMADLDRKESGALHDDITALLENFVHPRHVARIQPLLRVATALLYYGVPLLSLSHSTPGQDFASLSMVVDAPPTGSRVGAAFTKLSQGRYMTVAVLLAVLPQLEGLWAAHSPSVALLLATLTADDRDERGREEDAPQPGSLLDAVVEHVGLDAALEEAGPAPEWLAGWARRLQAAAREGAARLGGAISATYVEICQQLNADDGPHASLHGVRHLASLLLDVHQLCFVLFGLYFHPALRLAAVKLVRKVPPQKGGGGTRSISLRVLGWILGFRLALLSANALVLLRKHWRLQGQPTAPQAAALSGAGLAAQVQQQSISPAYARFNVAGMGSRQCPLCMEALQHPAVTPCGHVYCWSCIQGLCVRSSAASASSFLPSYAAQVVASKSKCPVCRAEFSAQRVRAIICGGPE